MAERSWTKTKAIYKGHDYTKDGLKTNQQYEVAYRITPANTIEVWANHPGQQARQYRNQKELAKQWQFPR